MLTLMVVQSRWMVAYANHGREPARYARVARIG